MKKIMTLAALVFVSALAQAATFTIYTDRPTARVQHVADLFKAQTGLSSVIVELPYKDLLQKLKTEGDSSPADVIFTKDIVYQAELAKLGFYQPMNMNKISSVVDRSMRDTNNLWTAVTFRARTLVYDPNVTDVSSIEKYEDLAKPEWAGRLCLRTSNNSYNETLVASFIHRLGYNEARSVLTGMVANLATDVSKSDTALLENIANGICDVGLANHYYLAQLVAQKPNFPVRLKFLDQNGRGVHVNGSGVGIAKTSKSVAASQKFIELLMTDSVQIYLSEAHFEYPAATHLLPTSLIKEWGTFKSDKANWTEIGLEAEKAKKLVKEVGYL